MAGVIRVAISHGIANKVLLKNSPAVTSLVRYISGKVKRGTFTDKESKQKPWPYTTKGFNFFHYLYDKTSTRFDENSKIIVVDGPIAAGKSAFAKDLAADLGMLYMPEANLDMLLTNSYGFNLKQLDEQLPPSTRSFDVYDFCRNPQHLLTANFQINQYIVKFAQYLDALAHIFSTGEGIILDRSCYSDFVFVEAMYKQGFITKGARSVYYDIRDNTISELLKPHLVIYLDVPVAQVKKNIEKRAIPYEKQSRVFSSEYLTSMENSYKQKYLNEMSKNSELLIYDWTEPGEIEIVIEDIERINFGYEDNDPKCEDWRFFLEEDWAMKRRKYTNTKEEIMQYFNVPRTDVPELMTSAEDIEAYYGLVNNAPGNKYMSGYNADMGDKGLLTNIGFPRYEPLPRIERMIIK